MYLCFSREKSPNEVLEACELQGKTIQQIEGMLKLKNQYIAYQSPLFREKLDSQIIPLSIYPNLILNEKPNKYPPPKHNLFIYPNTRSEYSVKVQIQTQLKQIFPTMEIEFNKKQLNEWKAKDLLDMCIKTFSFDCSETQLLNQENEDLNERNDDLVSLFEYSKAKHLIFKCLVGESALKKINTRCCLSAEVLSSEQSFVSDIISICDYWKPAFEDSRIFDSIQLRYLFRDIKPILKTHIKFLAALNTIEIDYFSEFGGIFLNFVERFKVSLSFVSNFKNVDEMIKKKRTSSRYAEAKFDEIEQGNPAGNGRDFLSYYITPVQRYPRYPLLIRDLDKNTPPFHPDKIYLSLALSELDNANKDIDHTSHRVKQLILMEALQKTLPESFFLMEEGRELIMEKNITIPKPRTGAAIIYLFNDIVLIVTKGKKVNSPLCQSKVDEFRFSNNRPTIESIMTTIHNKDYIINFEDYSEKIAWMDALNQVRTNALSNISCHDKFAKWTDIEIGEHIFPLMNHSGCFYEGKAYFFGGANASLSPSSMFIEYDVSNNRWSGAKSPIQSRVGHSIHIINGKLYVVFGNAKGKFVLYIDEYTLGSNGGEWKKLKLSHDCRRTGHSSITYQDYIVVFGGKTEKDTFLDDVLFIDTISGTIERLNNLPNAPSPRINHDAVLIDKSMIIIGGRTNNGINGDIFAFDLEQKTWTSISEIKIEPRFGHRTVLLGYYLFVIGGITINNNKDLPNCAIDTRTWQLVNFQEFGNKPPVISRFALTKIDSNRAITFGGSDSGTKVPFSSSWIIDVEEGFSDTREYIPPKVSASEIRRQVITLPMNSSEIKDNSSKNSPLPPPPPPPLPSPTPIPSSKVKTLSFPNQSVLDAVPRKTTVNEIHSNIHPLPPPNNTQVQSNGPITMDALTAIREKMKRRSMGQFQLQKSLVDDEVADSNLSFNNEVADNIDNKRNSSSSNDSAQLSSDDIKEDKTPIRRRYNVRDVPLKSLNNDNNQRVLQSPMSMRCIPPPELISTESNNRASNRIVLLPGRFDPQYFYKESNIDVSYLSPIEQSATRMKAHKVYQKMSENDELENKIKQIENNSTEKKKNVILKILDDIHQETKACKIPNDASINDIIEKTNSIIGRDGKLSIAVDSDSFKELNEEAFEEAKQALTELKYFKVIVL
ncbi:kelch repeat protein [Tritrichomonas foetus]|uniref:Kelch repeat protein n=1 Tax=Tritrichomonas foetus TaxID=1144522 RepID=A0A1J4K996_9EUKA|nr:kelch repeat protein [Tritrichomonas foetus]|eukprot:OHT06013.1 kelch repeat protein [Tritrichomonas foetus]